MTKKPRRLDLRGQRFGLWTVLEKGDVGPYGAVYWKCQCDCGTAKDVLAGILKAGTSRSCGCNRAKHGYSRTPTAAVWYGMRQRCYNPNDKNYPSYGGRGIKVCDRWLESFENFLADMGLAPEGLTLDRIEVDGDYEPENCRWATRQTQQRNRRNNPRVVHEGKSVTLVELAERYGLTLRSLRFRVQNNWDLTRALETPSRPKRTT